LNLLGKNAERSITQLDEDHYWMVGSGMAERYHQRFFNAVPRSRDISFSSKTVSYCGFNVAGPNARELLSRLTNTDLSNDNWPFMRSKKITVNGIETIGLRVSFTGDLGWELYVPEEHQLKLYDALFAAGESLHVVPVGGRSLLSLRVEKGYGSWGREYSPEYWPQEVGLDRLIKLEKAEFLGRKAYTELMHKPAREKLVMLEMTPLHNADASGGEPVFLKDGTAVGRVSSGAYGYSVEKSLALAFIQADKLQSHREFDVAVLGDSKGEKLRS